MELRLWLKSVDRLMAQDGGSVWPAWRTGPEALRQWHAEGWSPVRASAVLSKFEPWVAGPARKAGPKRHRTCRSPSG